MTFAVVIVQNSVLMISLLFWHLFLSTVSILFKKAVESSVGFKHIPASYCATFFCTALWKSQVLPLMLPRRLSSVSTNNLLDLAMHAFSISDLHSTAMHSNRKLCTLKRLHLLWMQTLHFLHNMDYCKHLPLDYSYNRQHRTKLFMNI